MAVVCSERPASRFLFNFFIILIILIIIIIITIILIILLSSSSLNLRRIFEPKRDVNGEWRRLHNEELHGLYLSSNIIRVIKSRRLRWADLVARRKECFQNFNR